MPDDLRVYQRLLLQARPYWPHIVVIFVLSLAATPLALLTPLPLKIAVDSALSDHPLPAALIPFIPRSLLDSPSGPLLVSIVLLCAITVLTHVRGLASGVLETYTGERLVRAFRSELFDRVQRLSLAYHDRKGPTDSVYRIQYDAPSIQWVAVQGIIPFVSSVLTVAGMTYVIVRIDAQLVLVAMLAVPILFVTTQVFRRRIRREWSMVKELESSTMSGVQEALSSVRVVKAFAQEGRERERFLRSSGQSLRGQLRLAAINGGFDAVIGLTIAVSSAAVLYLGVEHVRSGQLTLGNLLLVMAYLSQLYPPLRAISKKIADLQAALVSAERVFAVLDQNPEVPERRDPRPLARAAGAVVYRDVCFAYPGGPAVLNDVSMAITPGDRVGIMGETGAGKTTLLSLLMRFYDPTSGSITIDGIDLA